MIVQILSNLQRLDKYIYQIPPVFDFMSKPVRLYANHELLEFIKNDETLLQLVKSTALPHLVQYSLAMPDAHQGYALPIGGVVATKYPEGVISPGAVGYDINCGVRLLRTNLLKKEIKPYIDGLIDLLFSIVPTGIGDGASVKLTYNQLDKVLSEGMNWALKEGYATKEDVLFTQDSGQNKEANPDKVDKKSKERGKKQLGSLGSGNHFLEIQYVKEIYDKELANFFSINEKDQIFILLHTGGRGLSHGVCGYYINSFLKKMKKDEKLSKLYKLDKTFASLYMKTSLAQDYFQAMNAAANYAFVNRQLLTYQVRKAFSEVFSKDWQAFDLSLIYDIAHNIAKIEEHIINGKKQLLLVHRKGATRALPKGHKLLNDKYRQIGEPVLLPGAMGKESFLLVSNQSNSDAFFTCAHGSGRVLSRMKARKLYKGKQIKKELEDIGVRVRIKESRKKVKGKYDPLGELAEESWHSYKDPHLVLDVCVNSGLVKKVASFKTLAVIKG